MFANGRVFPPSSLGDPLRDDLARALKFGYRFVNITTLGLQSFDLFAESLGRDVQLRGLSVAKIVKVEHRADFLERKSDALAEQHELQPRAVAAAVNPLLPLPAGSE